MTEIDDKSKQVLLRHMNADHQLDIGLYLRHINGLSEEQLAKEGAPEMLDIDLKSMTIRTATTGTIHIVPLEPPMASWGERRTRLVSMALEARTRFGVPLPEHAPAAPVRAPIPYHAPVGMDLVVLCSVTLYAVCVVLVYSGHDEAAAGAWAQAVAASGIESGPFIGEEGFRFLVRQILLPVIIIHAGEAWWMDRTRLVPHNMRRGSRAWLQWMISTAWEGFGAFRRFDRLAAAASSGH